MQLRETYKKVRPSVVAIVARTSQRSDFPLIIGTGVVIHKDGFILTNSHVADLISKLPRAKDALNTEWPAMVLFLYNSPNEGVLSIPIDIIGVMKFRLDPLPEKYYGDQPDLAILHIGSIKNIPSITVAKKDLEVGGDVGISGFPMGTDTLAAPGWIHQLTPTLQKGIISAQLPFECDAPHGLMIDVVTEGGSSGSPIFDTETGELVGLLYGGLYDYDYLRSEKNDLGSLRYAISTSHTFAISNFWIRCYLENFLSRLPIDSKEEYIRRIDFNDYINTKQRIVNKPRSQSRIIGSMFESDKS